MALHPNFPGSPHVILEPDVRWFPADKALREWCVDINKAQYDIHYDYVFVDEESFNKYKPKNFEALISGFRDYKD